MQLAKPSPEPDTEKKRVRLTAKTTLPTFTSLGHAENIATTLRLRPVWLQELLLIVSNPWTQESPPM